MTKRATTRTDVVDRIKLAPDAGLVKSLGANHTLESAVADIVDNSVDAKATRVSIRLLTQNDRLTQVEILDNGHGMDERSITKALTIGHQRDYLETDLGHFGIGLKAASFAHSDVLTIWSKSATTDPVGRRIRRADFSKDFSCEVLSTTAAAEAATYRKLAIGRETGTSVIWTSLNNVYRGKNNEDAKTWIAKTEQALRSHLGLVFHRLIEKGSLRIDVLRDELAQANMAIPVPVKPIDPFAYSATGYPGYPKKLQARTDAGDITFWCHIWPPKSDVTGYRIGGKAGEEFQGFFIYRKDRLLQAGGWSGLVNPSPARQLARVVLEGDPTSSSFLTMNAEKHGLRFEPIFNDALSIAVAADGTTFDKYLLDAEFVYTDANKRNRSRKPAIAPTKGFAPKLRRVIGKELPMIEGESLKMQWRLMPKGEFLDIDFPQKTLWLNKRYRQFFVTERGSSNDAPVVKALLYLLTHHVFEGQYLGVRDRDEIALWKSVLGAAVLAEAKMRGEL